jgi:hypothetical protein
MSGAEGDRNLVSPGGSAGCASWPSDEAPEGCAYTNKSAIRRR